jgi:hypothetical protein
MAYLAKPEEKSILRQLRSAITNVNKIPTDQFYDQVSEIYSWRQVAERTEKVYDYAMEKNVPNVMARIKSTFCWGPIIGLWALIYTVIEGIVLFMADVFLPEDQIDITRAFSQEEYNESPETFGDHGLFVSTEDSRYVCPKHRNTKIIDEYYSSTKPKQTFKLNNLNRYATIRPKIKVQIDEEQSSSDDSDSQISE